MTSLFKARGTSRDVKMKVVEFLYFYLMPEAPSSTSTSAPSTAVLQRSPNKLRGISDRPGTYAGEVISSPGLGNADGSHEKMKTTEEKTKLLGRFLNNVEDLVQDLRDNAPFGEVW